MSQQLHSEQIVKDYLKYFSEGNILNLEKLLADDFCLQGPLYHFKSRSDYIKNLSQDLEPAKIRLVQMVSSHQQVSAFYHYQKPSSPELLIAQWFDIDCSLICKTLLVFDSSGF